MRRMDSVWGRRRANARLLRNDWENRQSGGKIGRPFLASGHLNDLNHLMIELCQSKRGTHGQ